MKATAEEFSQLLNSASVSIIPSRTALTFGKTSAVCISLIARAIVEPQFL
jgi:hypothetical protein